MTFAPLKKQNLAQQVAGALRDAILGGRLEVGGAMPSERNLAEQFGVNRLSIREALKHLDGLGLVEIRHGGATKVLDHFTSAGLQLLPYLVAPGGLVDRALVTDLLELRVALMSWVAQQAALRAGPKDIERLQDLLNQLQAGVTATNLQDADYDFFEGLVGATQNRALRLLSNSIRGIYMLNGEHFLYLYSKDVFDSTHHRRALDAIRDGRAQDAGRAMQAHAETALQPSERR